MTELNIKELQAPFDPTEVEWRVQPGGYNQKTQVLAYIDARAIQNRLDQIAGPENWKIEQPVPVLSSVAMVSYDSKYWDQSEGKHVVTPKVGYGLPPARSKAENVTSVAVADKYLSGFLCGLSIKLAGEWLTRWDGSDTTDFQPFKGGLSGAFKRAAAQWGIGRYLYDLDDKYPVLIHSHIHESKKKDKIDGDWKNWLPPLLPDWALPDGYEGDQYAHLMGAPQPKEEKKDEPAPQAAPPSSADIHAAAMKMITEATSGDNVDLYTLEDYRTRLKKKNEEGALSDNHFKQVETLIDAFKEKHG